MMTVLRNNVCLDCEVFCMQWQCLSVIEVGVYDILFLFVAK